MPRKISMNCAIRGCNKNLKMSIEERQKLREEGEALKARAGIICPKHVREVFDFERDEINIGLSIEEFLVESIRNKPQWHILLTPYSGAEQQSRE